MHNLIMQTAIKTEKIQEILTEFKEQITSLDTRKDVTEPGYGFTLNIPVSYKKKYDLIQEKTNKKFGKALKTLVIKAIDSIELDETAS